VAPQRSGSTLYFAPKAQTLDRQARRKMIEPNPPDLSVGKECSLLSISLSSVYFDPKNESARNLDQMRQIPRPSAACAAQP